MDTLNEYSYIWEEDKEKYVLLKDEFGVNILYVNGKEIKVLLIEDDIVEDSIVSKMIGQGNRVYNSIIELKEVIGIK